MSVCSPGISKINVGSVFRIVVSAPHGQASGARLERTENSHATGVIYLCPITPGPCVGLIRDGMTGNPTTDPNRRLYDVDR